MYGTMEMIGRSRATRQSIPSIAERILTLERAHPTRVGIDGFCGAGKTTLANQLADELRARGRTVIRACGDDFQNPPNVRWRLGDRSPEGFFRDAIDFEALRSEILEPLGPAGSLKYRTSIYDVHASRPNVSPQSQAQGTEVLLIDGLFLHTPTLAGCFELTIFVDAAYETCIARARVRRQERRRSADEIEALYRERYVPGFQLYVAEAQPQKQAALIHRT
jgi:uridine kinase